MSIEFSESGARERGRGGRTKGISDLAKRPKASLALRVKVNRLDNNNLRCIHGVLYDWRVLATRLTWTAAETDPNDGASKTAGNKYGAGPRFVYWSSMGYRYMLQRLEAGKQAKFGGMG